MYINIYFQCDFKTNVIIYFEVVFKLCGLSIKLPELLSFLMLLNERSVHIFVYVIQII